MARRLDPTTSMIRAPFRSCRSVLASACAAAMLSLPGCREVGGAASSGSDAPTAAAASAAGQDAQPGCGLAVGDRAPDASLTTIEGGDVSLRSYFDQGPVVLTFYRGSWCPICTKALSGWQSKLAELREAGGTFVAVTPERLELAAATREERGLEYVVLGDPAFEAARAYGLHFVVDDETKTRYTRDYGLDVGAANVSGTWELPAPATFVIDREGVIRYVFADWDYRKRADPDEVIAAVRALTG